MINQINPVPPDELKESHTWREWFVKVTAYLKAQQQVLTIPSYATTAAPTAVAGTMYFDTTLGKFRACEVSGTWRTITTV